MLSIVKKYIKENTSIIIVLICLSFVAVFNAFMNIGIIEDGCHNFWEALIADNIWLGHEGIDEFPFNPAYFPTIIQHLSVGIPILLGLTSIKILLFIFTFTSYFLPILLLFIIYINIPKDKRKNFEMILLYFLICINFMINLIWAENLITGLFLWTIFIIYYYVDFDKLSKINLISLIIFSLFLISSHPMTAIFVLPMIIFAIIKQSKTKNVPKLTDFCLITSYILLFIAFVFNFYFIIEPVYPANDYLSCKFVLQQQAFLYLSTILIFTLIISIIKFNNRQTKHLLNFLFILICCGMLKFVLLEIKTYEGLMYRILGFYVPLFFMLFILFKDFFKLIINYKYIKILNFILLFIFVFHSIHYGKLWNEYLINVKNIMLNNKNIIFEKIVWYDLQHYQSFAKIFVLMPNLFGIEQNYKIILSGEDVSSFKREFLTKDLMCSFIEEEIYSYKKQLSKFNIKADVFIFN